MKTLFVTALLLLAAALAATRWSEPDVRSEVPVIYWVIDPAPVRGEHIRLFELWQIKNGHCAEHVLRTPADVVAFRKRQWSPAIATAIREGNALGGAVLDGTLAADRLPVTMRVPKCEMRLDAASNDMSKKLIQGVSGVAGDVMEVYADGNVQFFAGGGLIADVTEDAKRLGFGPEMTYPGMKAAITYNGRQYSFPRNPGTYMLWVNKDTFAKYGQPLPPRRWTVEEFEARGKAFMAAANPPGQRRQVFFANCVDIFSLRRTCGIDTFNETMTRCVLNDPRAARAYALLDKWREEDHLFPTSAEEASFATQSTGWGGGPGQLFANGNFGMLLSGRYQLMQLRQFEKPVQLAVVEQPYVQLPCNGFASGQATVYRGSRHLDLATLFLAFYASEDYSMQLVRDGDGLPPIPKYTQTEEFLRPKAFPNEWGCHEVLAEDAMHNAISPTFSSFVQYGTVLQCEWTVGGAVNARRLTPAEAVRELEDRINRAIEVNLKDNPRLKAQYAAACAVQARIDACKKEGRPVPAEWVTNPYHKWMCAKEREGVGDQGLGVE
jgi:multiple sugar transport system substrate-binding protein